MPKESKQTEDTSSISPEYLSISRSKEINILIIDRHRSGGTLLKSLLIGLTQGKIDVSTAIGDTIQRCRLCRYHLVFVHYDSPNNFSGTELLNHLKKQKLVAPDVASVIITNDLSQEVVLSALDALPDILLCQPYSKQIIHDKLHKIEQLHNMRHQVLTALSKHDPSTAIKIGLHFMQNQMESMLEPLMCALIEEHGLWLITHNQIEKNQFPLPPRFKSRVQAMVHAEQGELDKSANILKRLLKDYPMMVECYDLIAKFLFEQKDYENALIYARQAYQYTPTNYSRAIFCAIVANELNQSDAVIQYSFHSVKCLPYYDDQWLEQLVYSGELFLNLIRKTETEKQLQDLRLDLKIWFERGKQRLPMKQHELLQLYYQSILAQTYLFTDKKEIALQTLLNGIRPFYNNANTLAPELNVTILPMLLNFGEMKMAHHFYRALNKTYSAFVIQRLERIFSREKETKKTEQLVRSLMTAKKNLYKNSANAVSLYSIITNQYPCCTEAQLGLMDSLLRCNQPQDARLPRLNKSLQERFMTTRLRSWLTALVRKYRTQKNNANDVPELATPNSNSKAVSTT